MKAIYFSIISLLCMGSALSEPPEKHNLSRYRALWSNSPFTKKPDPVSVDKDSPLKDWVLGGIAGNSTSGYSITLINKKNRNQRARLNSNKAFAENLSEGFSIVEVVQGGLDYKKSKVKIASGKETAWVTYDEQVLAFKPKGKAPAAQNPNRNAAGNTPGQAPKLPNGLKLPNGQNQQIPKLPSTNNTSNPNKVKLPSRRPRRRR